jgi:hypothetical protein
LKLLQDSLTERYMFRPNNFSLFTEEQLLWLRKQKSVIR